MLLMRSPLNMLRSLTMYAEGEPRHAKRIAQAVIAHLTAEYSLLQSDPVYKWASSAWRGSNPHSQTVPQLQEYQSPSIGLSSVGAARKTR